MNKKIKQLLCKHAWEHVWYQGNTHYYMCKKCDKMHKEVIQCAKKMNKQ